jgi:Domain of unknown function (DUF4136)
MIRSPLPALAALALLAACAVNPWTVDSFEAPEADVAGKRTFIWRDGEVGAPLIKRPAVAADTQARLRAAITHELTAKGYVETTDAAAADMVVSFQVSGSRRFEPSDQRRIGAPSPNEVLTPGNVRPPPASEVPREVSVRTGNVMVFAENPGSGQLMWRGMVSAEIRTSSLERTVDKVIDAGRHIAQGFPARRTTP